jgi:hypothetical protein
MTLLTGSLLLGFNTGWLQSQSQRYAAYRLPIGSSVLDGASVYWYSGVLLVVGVWLDTLKRIF